MARSVRIAAATATCAILAILLPVGASGGDGKPSNGCPPGFNLDAVTFAEWLALPRTQAAINDGIATAEQIVAGLVAVDKNENGVVCAKLQHGLEVSNRPFNDYLYYLSDDNSSKR
jgi:hypothetical protein